MVPAANPAAEFVARLQSRGVSLGLRGNRLFLSPSSVYREMTPEDRETLRAHRPAIKELIRTAGPFVISPRRDTAALAPQPEPEAQPTPPREPEPVLFVGGKRITEDDVQFWMADLGDEELAAYKAGRISKADAYARTKASMIHAEGFRR